jgi:hypothetical protein
MATAPAATGQGNILERLSKNELRTVEDVQTYVRAVQQHAQLLSQEIDFAAAQIEANLRDGNHGLSRAVATYKAKRTARALRKVRDHVHGAQISIVRFWSVFRREWEEALSPATRSKKGFEFNRGNGQRNGR